ncbi:plasmid pRiA4b ORF-3 family protein [Lentibacillus sp. CBA3610]|uniref:plasmid pRiA4b ORF-3 family protein n=1 Tax=Lentibacillus sp. CBA3610 TaxID=2518176 RepID=UPI001595D301|nr:plasmid pRiA4b ORF-3 family protein [Lentibacillus sp. CBA3610]QKY70191.1 plasmid pRiA4b ORF-3 family protein [Lentibacillus sp. CBA3610]
MFIRCTKKMLDHLKVKPDSVTEQTEVSSSFSWHANVVRINRRQSVVLMHDKSQYVIILYGVRAKEFSRMNSLIEKAIRIVWREEGIKESVIDAYLARAGEVQFTKTKNRSLIARLNQACRSILFFEDELNGEQLIQPELSLRISRLLVGVEKGDYAEPNEMLYDDLKQLSGEEIFSVRAVELNVRLMLEEKNVWRRLIVPLDRTFPQLHNILQTAIGWRDYHLHEFFVFDDHGTDDALSNNHPGLMADDTKAIVNLVDNEEAFDYPDEIPRKLETGIKLTDYLPEAKQLAYVYDLGDDWRHWIEVTDVIENYASNHPVCLDGEGDAPPEDVGGEGGYLEFLEIIDDPNHPEHDDMKQWARSQLYTSFNLKKVNHILKTR